MKKTKLLTSLAALALVVSLGACEVNVDVGGVDVGDVDVGVDVNPNDSSEPDEGGTTDTDTNPGTGEGGEGGDTDTDSGSGEAGGEQTTYTYSLEVENGDSLTLTYDEALETQQGVELSIKLVTTSSTGDVTKEDATADNLTFTVSDPTIVTVSGLTVLPLSGGETSITVKWSEHEDATASVGVTVTDVTVYGPTSWADYITNEYDLGVIAGAFGDVPLDDILPFSYEVLTNTSYSFQTYYVSTTSFRLMYSWPSDSNGLTSAWDTLLTDFGYTKVSSETSGVYTTVTYTLEGGYKIEIKYSSVGDWDLYLYPPEPEPEAATTWNEYITNDYDRSQIASLFGSVEALDEILPFYIGDTDPTSITTGSSVNGTRLIITYNTEPTGLLNNWIGLLVADGWTQTGHESSYNEIYTFEKDGYKVELVSEFGSFYLYLYPKAEEPEPASAWDEYITNENYRAAVSEIFGSVEALDEFLPFYGDTEPTSIVTGTHYSKGARLVIQYNSDVLSAWVSLFEADGWTQTDHAVSYNETYTFEKDGYTVDLELEYGVTYVYAYPKAEEEENTGLETAQAILNAAAAQTNGFQDFEYVNVQARYSNGGGGAYDHYNFDLTTDNSNLFGREIRHDEDGDDETKFRTRYYYEKYYYDINNTSGANTHTGPTSNSYNGVNGVLGWRLTSSRNYDAAFDNASSIDLANATDFELTTEANGNYKLTFIYNSTWYCYKATADCKLVGAGSAINWTSSSSYEIYYGEEESEETFNALMEPFFDDEYWFPKQASEEEIASSILESAEDTTITWSAFHGEYIDESTDETDTLYLTTDSDGLYGSGICLDDGDPSFEYYYKNGKEYVHNSNNDSYYDGEFYYGDTYADILSDFTSDALDNADWPDLDDDDDWTLTTLTDGYELVVDTYLITTGYKTIQAQLVYITDTNFNITGLGYATFDSTFGNIEGWYAEQATTAQVEASLEGFDPANWGEGDGGDETTPSWADYLTDDNYAKATELLGKTLDEVLPVVLPEGLDYQQISVASSSISFDASDWFTYDGNYPYDYNALNSAWAEALIAAGYTTNDEGATYTDGTYKVTIEYVDYSTIMGYGITWTLTLSLA